MKPEQSREAWNKGKLVGQKPPLRPKDVWAIRIYLQNAHVVRDLALFNLAIDNKLRGCDLVRPRAQVIQRKTQRPVQFELTESTRKAVGAWLEKTGLKSEQYLFPSRLLAVPASFDSAICPDHTSTGGCSGARSDCVRHALDAPNQRLL